MCAIVDKYVIIYTYIDNGGITMNYLRNLFLMLTASGAIISFYMKVSRDFPMELIKTKYKNVPGKQGIFEVVTVYTMVSLFVIDIITLFKTVPDAVKNGFNQTVSTGIGNIFSIIIVILAMSVLLSIILTPFVIYSKASDEFKHKLENREFKNISNFIIVWNIICGFVSICISVYCIYAILSNLTQYTKLDKYENNFIFISNIDISTMKNIILLGIILFICITLFIIQISLSEIITAINDDYKYILDTENGLIECNIFLEYNEYYLLFKDNTEQYINKSKVKNIVKKGLDKERGSSMGKRNRYDKTIDKILDLEKHKEYVVIKEKIEARYKCDRDIDLELERIEENIESTKSPYTSYLFTIMGTAIPTIVAIWIAGINKENDQWYINIVLTIALLYVVGASIAFIYMIKESNKKFQILIIYRDVLQKIKNGGDKL